MEILYGSKKVKKELRKNFSSISFTEDIIPLALEKIGIRGKKFLMDYASNHKNSNYKCTIDNLEELRIEFRFIVPYTIILFFYLDKQTILEYYITEEKNKFNIFLVKYEYHSTLKNFIYKNYYTLDYTKISIERGKKVLDIIIRGMRIFDIMDIYYPWSDFFKFDEDMVLALEKDKRISKNYLIKTINKKKYIFPVPSKVQEIEFSIFEK